MTPLPSFPHLASGGPRLRDARRLVALIGRWRPLRITSDDARGRGHAWQIAGGWDPGQERWEIRIDTGYVNGREVLCPSQPLEELPEETLARLEAAGGKLPETGRAWLSDRPSIGVSDFRPVGTDATSLNGSGEEIPEFFLERGVVPPDEISTNGQQITRTQTGTGDQLKARRLLRACDVVLNQPRVSARLEVGEGNRPEVRLDLPGDTSPYLTIRAARYEPAGEAGNIQEEFARAVSDDGVDRILIGRLWLLSPAGAAPGSEPTAAWTAYGQNEVFYHLDYDVNVDIDVIEPLDLGFTVPLAGGVAQLTISSLTAEINANDALASVFLSKGRVVGRFRSV